MKKLIMALALSCAGLSTVCAAEETRSWYPLIGAGVTFGGSNLATVQYTNGSSSNIRAGDLVYVYGGVDYRGWKSVALQATVGYHFDRADATNGSLTFGRIPIELLAYYRFNDHWRAGGGVRFVTDPRLSGSGVANGADVKFRSTTGGVIEGEYLFAEMHPVQLGVKLRYVIESYQVENGGPSFNGNHVGILTSVYF